MVNKKKFEKGVQAINDHNAKALAALFAPEAKVYDPFYPEPLTGRDAIEQDFVEFLRAFPNLRMTLIGGLLEEGDSVAGVFRVEATHTGTLALPAGEVPATGRQMSFEGAAFTRYNEHGEVVEQRRYFDVAGQLSQLGVE